MAVKKRLMLVDGDHALRKELVAQFAPYDEFEVVDVDNATDAIKAAASSNFDLILLDMDLPDMLGIVACQLMRTQGVMAPIIMLTANVGEVHKFLGLNSGANDYVEKPFHFEALLARVRSQLRSFGQPENASFQTGTFEFSPSFKKLTRPADEIGNQPHHIRLTKKETNILKYLYRAGGLPVGRDELLREVWGYNSSVSTHTLETHIYRLRLKIEPVKGKPTFLMTTRDGYYLKLS